MILNGKAKEDFIDYLWKTKFKKEDYKEYEEYLSNQKENHTNSDIIEWFDNMGIWETVFYNVYMESTVTTKFSQILNRAIIKANEIYNER